MKRGRCGELESGVRAGPGKVTAHDYGDWKVTHEFILMKIAAALSFSFSPTISSSSDHAKRSLLFPDIILSSLSMLETLYCYMAALTRWDI